jgi:GlcNAc-P-P-Und epimerase
LNICIIGGSGFIGTSLSKNLIKKKNKFLIIDKTKSEKYPDLVQIANVRNIESLRKRIPDNSILINLAAEHRDDVKPISLYKEVNVNGAKNICIVAREKNIKKIIFTSTVAVYGFAPIGTDENGKINPFNEYGKTKYKAEQIYRLWQEEAPEERTLVIIRPTVVFGENNRGNVYNLFHQIISGKFIMVGDGYNKKSMAYVDNVVAFITYSLIFTPGIHIYNYVDKPDFTMNSLVSIVRGIMGFQAKLNVKIPYIVGLFIGKVLDFLTLISGKKFAISSIRIKKFCANSVYNTAIDNSGFKAPITIKDALEKTIIYEFIEKS